MHKTHLASVDLNLLVVLEQLFQAGSVTGAAERLGLSQPAVSRSLGRLRELLADPLFVRTPRGPTPTPRAERLRAPVAELLARAQALVEGDARFDPAQATRVFTIATSDYGETALLPPLLKALSGRAPRVSLRIMPTGMGWERAMQDGAVELVWTPKRKTPLAGTQLVWTHLFDEDFAFVVRRGHPLTRGRLTLERYLSIAHVAIAPEGRPGNPLDELLAKLGRERRVVAQIPTFLAVAPLVADSDLGVTLPRRIVAALAERWQLQALELPFDMPSFGIAQAWPERLRHDPGHAWFRQLVAEVGRSLAGAR
ncbi:MAG: LysR family transcriptional regulator [Myxococcales bacterium]